MPFDVTVALVKEGFTTTAGDDEINDLIMIIDQADDCLTANSVAENIGRRLKAIGVRYLLALSSENAGGHITSQRANDGSARSFSGDSMMSAERLLRQLRAIDKHGCVLAQVESTPSIQLFAAGREQE